MPARLTPAAPASCSLPSAHPCPWAAPGLQGEARCALSLSARPGPAHLRPQRPRQQLLPACSPASPSEPPGPGPSSPRQPPHRSTPQAQSDGRFGLSEGQAPCDFSPQHGCPPSILCHHFPRHVSWVPHVPSCLRASCTRGSLPSDIREALSLFKDLGIVPSERLPQLPIESSTLGLPWWSSS